MTGSGEIDRNQSTSAQVSVGSHIAAMYCASADPLPLP